jgi:DNA-binding CsgD family transcriptional regulator
VNVRRGNTRAGPGAADPLADAGFSRREREVLAELVGGLDNRAIASRLCISEETVKCHVKAIFRKLGARDRAHAVAVALGAAPPQAPVVPLRPAAAAAPRAASGDPGQRLPAALEAR